MTTSLREAWLRLHARGGRARDAAEELGVTEAELLASTGDVPGASVQAFALDLDEPAKMFEALPRLGTVKTQTRNASVVLEVIGPYPAARVSPKLDQWASCFAVHETIAGGPRKSLQIFDRRGASVQKVWLVPESDARAFAELSHAPSRARPPVRGTPGAPRPTAPRAPSPAIPLARLVRQLARGGTPIRISLENLGVSQFQDLRLRRVVAKGDWLSAVDTGAKILIHRARLARVAAEPAADPVSPSRLDLYDADSRAAVLSRVAHAAG